jgi:adenylate cyclase
MNVARSAVGDRGEQQRLIKTLPRKGFRFVGKVREEQLSDGIATADVLRAPSKPALALPDKPSVAALPFVNKSGDPQQDIFAEGLTEDITTELSRFSDLFIIAPNSSFHYRGSSPTPKQVGRELGVGYVLEGSVRRSGDNIRITAQLSEAATGVSRWAERYDRTTQNVFVVQDEIARTIAGILSTHVQKAEAERALLKPPATWQAYDHYMRGCVALARFWSTFRSEHLFEARRSIDQSLAIDPKYARAFAALSRSYATGFLNPVNKEFLNTSAIERAHDLVRTALELDPDLPEALAILSNVLTWKAEHDAAIAAFERALQINPNFTNSRFSAVYVMAGEFPRAIDMFATQMRLDPFYSPLTPHWLGLAHFMLGQYSQALPLLVECVSRAPNFLHGHIWLAATYSQLGRLSDARGETQKALQIYPGYTIGEAGRRIGTVWRHRTDAERYFQGLHKAGLPER